MGNRCGHHSLKTNKTLTSHHGASDCIHLFRCQESPCLSKSPGGNADSSTQIGQINGKCQPIGVPASRSEDDIPHVQVFTYRELVQATQNFHHDNIIGRGGFGYVYKGWINLQNFTVAKPGCGTPVAVKKLKTDGLQGHKEWLSEVSHLGQLHHPNLITLIGYCLERDNRLLVYEYLPNECVDSHLFEKRNQPLSWAQRMTIATGAAQVLSFLHELENPIIFRDFKTANLLLDANYNPKLSDLGFAKFGPTGDRTHVSTQVLGTEGYAAPEYIATGHLTVSCDVYSFGVVLLELLSGRRAIDKTKTSAEENLVEWAKPYLTGKRKVFRIMDIALEGKYPRQGAYMAAVLALDCIGEAKHRPSMKDVLTRLEKIPITKDDAISRESEQKASTSKHPRSSLGQTGHIRSTIPNESAMYLLY